MSVLIKGMEIPESCYECMFNSEADGECYVNDCKCEWGHSRPADCPLVEVPVPHGRLIDADELKKLIEDFNSNDIISYTIDEQEWRENTPTVIEAEE